MSVNWTDPITIAIRARTDLASMTSALWDKLFGKKTKLAFTGMEGVGKSVLLDLFTGEALKSGYKPRTRSQSVEQGKVQSGGKKLRVSVVPGQVAHPRYEALDDLFRGRNPVDGVIHVVCSGFASVRTPDAVRTLVKDHGLTTISRFRQYQKRRELEDLQQTCLAIRDSHRRHRGPKWMVVAVDKVDLFHDEVAEAQHLYSASSQSAFVRALNELSGQVGTDFFRWTSLPICGLIEDFEWNGKKQASQIREDKRRAYLDQFLRELEPYCQ